MPLISASILSQPSVRLRQALRSGRRADMEVCLQREMGQPGFEVHPTNLFQTAIQADQPDAWCALIEAFPDGVPSPERAWSQLGDVLKEGPIWMADWLVAHTDVAEMHREMEKGGRLPHNFLFTRALKRADLAGLAWLTQPFDAFPRWKDDSLAPALWESLRTVNVRDAAWADKVAHLLNHGALWMRRDEPLTYGQISPLGHLVRDYQQALPEAQEKIVPLLQRLWPLFIARGDGLEEPLFDTQTGTQGTVESALMATPLADWVAHWKRSQERLQGLEQVGSTSPPPKKARLRS